MEGKKEIAIKSEDYDTARMIKNEIERLKNNNLNQMLSKMDSNLNLNLNLKNNQSSDFQPSNNIDINKKEASNSEEMKLGKNTLNNINTLSIQNQDENNSALPETRIKTKMNTNTNMPLPNNSLQNNSNATNFSYSQKNKDKDEDVYKNENENEKGKNYEVNSNNLYLNELEKRKKNNSDKLNEFVSDISYPGKGVIGLDNSENKIQNASQQSLRIDLKSLLLPYMNIIYFSLLEMLFSSSPKLKEKALELLKEDIESFRPKYFLTNNKDLIFTTLIHLCGHLMLDPVLAISLKAKSLLSKILEIFPGEIRIEKTELILSLEKCISSLIDNISGENSENRDAAKSTLLGLSRHISVGPELTFDLILKLPPLNNVISNNNQTKGKLEALTFLINYHGLSKESLISKLIIEFGNSLLNHINIEIRQLALNLLTKTLSHLTNDVRTNQPLNEANEAMYPKVSNNNQDNIELRYNKNNFYLNEKALPVKDNKYSNQADCSICEFCGKFDKNFTTEKLDNHMYWDCPMLYLCSYCQNITEILHLRWHWLNECSSKEMFRECPRCKEPIIINEFEDHLFQNDCPPNIDDKSIRCPLCKKEIIPPTLTSWRAHIMNEICPRNKRSFI